jgi:hypothetical protein
VRQRRSQILLETRHDMKKRTSSKVSKTDWKRLHAMKEHQIKLSKEHPELDLKHVARTIVRKGLRPVPPKTSLALPGRRGRSGVVQSPRGIKRE